MKPPFSYFGGKQGMAAQIVDLLPAHTAYIEPFFGSGAVFFTKEPVKYEIVNDLDGALVTFFRVLRETPDDLARVCRLTPYSRDEFDLCRYDDPELEDLERARRFWVRVRQSFGGITSGVSGWSVSMNRGNVRPMSAHKAIERFHECARRLERTHIDNRDAVDLISYYSKTEDCVFYVDPPYVGDTRKGNAYAVDMPDEADHRRLLEALTKVEGCVVLSGYDSPLYTEVLEGWHRVERTVTTYSSNLAQPGSRSERTEVLWLNYEPEDDDQPRLFDAA